MPIGVRAQRQETRLMLCILYVNAIGALLGASGLLAERVLPASAARRGLWCIVIAMSMAIPGYYRHHHAASVGGVAPGPASAASMSSWERIESMDPTLDRVWLAMSALLAIWTLANMGLVSHIVRAARSARPRPGQLTTLNGVPVVVTNSLGPATVGIWHTQVLVPRWVLALPHAQQQYVVRHEEEHRRAQDGRLLFVASLLLILAPWNLALWWQLRRLSLAIEMDCDSRVIRALGDARAYGRMLLDIAQAASRGPRLQPALLGGVGMLEQRLTRLLSPQPLRRAQTLLLPTAAAVLVAIVLLMPHPVLTKAHAHAPDMARRTLP